MNSKTISNLCWLVFVIIAASGSWVYVEASPRQKPLTPKGEETFVSLEDIEKGDIQKHFDEQMETLRREKNSAGDQDRIDSILNRWFDEDFFKQRRDPFGDLQRFRNKLQKPFDDWYGKKFGGQVTEIKSREDAEAIYYEIVNPKGSPKDLKIRVESGMVSISGRTEQRSQTQGVQAFFSSSFTRRIPVPEGVDEAKVTMKEENGKIVIRFPRIRST